MADAIHRDAPCLHLRVFTARPKFLKGFVGGRFVDNADGHPGMHNHLLPEKRLGDTGHVAGTPQPLELDLRHGEQGMAIDPGHDTARDGEAHCRRVLFTREVTANPDNLPPVRPREGYRSIISRWGHVCMDAATNCPAARPPSLGGMHPGVNRGRPSAAISRAINSTSSRF